MFKRYKRIVCIFILLIFHSVILHAQIYAPKYSNAFLSIGIGARALGMSGVQSAITNDVTSAYWNPAGLQGIKTRFDVSLMHAEYFAGIAKYDYAGFATRLDSQSVIALSVVRFAIDNIPNTLSLYAADGAAVGQLNYNNIQFFSAADYAYLLSYARKSNLIKGLTLGVNLKIINRTVGSFATAWGFGFDVGAQYTTGKWKMGLVLRDVTSTFNAWSYNTSLLQATFAQTNNLLPTSSIELTLPSAIYGIARNFKITKKIGVLAATDLNITFDGARNTLVSTNVFSISPAVGLEIGYMKIVFLRFGAGNVQKVQSIEGTTSTSVQTNFGLGIHISKFTIDYALTNLGNISESMYSNVFSLKFSFDKIK
jgi:hypothetical protein